MIIIVCIDDNYGMMFNHRRQSQDKELRKTILQEAKGKKLWMNSYSAKQFEENCSEISVDEKFLQKAETGDYCFVEDIDIEPYIDYIDELILIRWNRVYPADTYLKIDLSEWFLRKKEEFKGNSHEKITLEDYIK